jgi:methyltransferase family protein
MHPFSPRLTRTTLRLEQALDELERTIVDRNGLEKRLELSWKQLSARMAALARRWDRADHVAYNRLYAKHVALQKSLSKAHRACIGARQNFHDKRAQYSAQHYGIMGQMQEYSNTLERMHRCQGGLSRSFGEIVERLKSQVQLEGGKPAFKVGDGAYGYIAYDVPKFLVLLARLDEMLADDADYAAPDRRYRPVSFLEIGCGPGRNLLLVRACGLIGFSRLAGFDINPNAVALGQQAFGLAGELQVADALSFDYGAWDVIYSFRPFSDIEMQQELEAHIARSMRKNAYLLAPLSEDLSLYRELAPIGMSTDIWKKIRPSR